MVDHLKIPFAFTKRGVFYFPRRIPKDLLGRYETDRVVFSLKTKSACIARQRAVNDLVPLHGDRPIDSYSRIEANQLRDVFE